MTRSVFSRLWIYQSERFPLVKTAPLLAAFSAASISVSALLAGRSLPHWSAFLVGFIIAMALFFQMRVCDEYKDLADDQKFRPTRPIPRGLVSLRLIITLGVASLPIAVLAAWMWEPALLLLLALTWVWLAAMTAEFGVPVWLKSRPVLYLVSHMAIMPLIDLLLTGIEWVPAGRPDPQLWLFLALSFVNGCVLEIGRKLWAPENEIIGVETYSGLWGAQRATWIWLTCAAVSFGLLVAVGIATGTGLPTAAIGFIGLGVCAWSARSYMQAATTKAQQRMDAVAGLWVLLCYVTAGFLPFLIRAL